MYSRIKPSTSMVLSPPAGAACPQPRLRTTSSDPPPLDPPVEFATPPVEFATPPVEFATPPVEFTAPPVEFTAPPVPPTGVGDVPQPGAVAKNRESSTRLAGGSRARVLIG